MTIQIESKMSDTEALILINQLIGFKRGISFVDNKEDNMLNRLSKWTQTLTETPKWHN